MSDDILSLEENKYGENLSIVKRKDGCNKRIEIYQQIYDKFHKEKGTKCSHENSLFKTLNLEFYGKKDYSIMLFNRYKKNIDMVTYDG